MNSSEALQRLKDGNARFVNGNPTTPAQNDAERQKHTGGQAPYAIILSCADSRVVPEQAFDTGLGEIFIIRVAGNVANTSAVASIEYAVANLGTKLIVVLGHESCGAVTAATKGGDNGPNLNKLVSYITPAVEKIGAESDLDEIIKENSKVSVKDMLAKSEIISNAVEKEGLEIVPAYYSLSTGEVNFDI